MAQLDPNAIAWDLGGSSVDLSGNEWTALIGTAIWDLACMNEYKGGGLYIPEVSGLYLCDHSFKFKNCLNVDGVEIGLFKGDDLYFVVCGANGFSGITSFIIQNSCMVDLYQGDSVTFRVRLLGDAPSATISAESNSGEEGDDLNDFTAWGLTYIHRGPL